MQPTKPTVGRERERESTTHEYTRSSYRSKGIFELGTNKFDPTKGM